MSLTDTAIKAAKPAQKPYKLFDGRGLYMLINTDGSRWWRFKYRYGGKEKLLALGTYPDIGLKRARDRHDDARQLLTDGIDPCAAKQAEKLKRADREAGSFEAVALEWHAKQSGAWSVDYAAKELHQLKNHVLPHIGGTAFRDVNSRDLLDLLLKIERKGRIETAHRVRRSLGVICRYAVATHRADLDPSAALKGALAPARTNHFASITEPKKVGRLIRAIRGYDGAATTRLALQLAPLLFVRPGELRAARWEEFAFDLMDAGANQKPQNPDPQWRIPAERMKMGEQHIVPLAEQGITILRELYAVTGPSGFLFPSVRSKTRCMSENTINAALRGMGFGKDEMTGHGFRHMASTLLHERGYKSEWIERQLAHGDRNSVRARYNFAEYLSERRRMMQEWANYLDGLAAGADVVNMHAAKMA